MKIKEFLKSKSFGSKKFLVGATGSVLAVSSLVPASLVANAAETPSNNYADLESAMTSSFSTTTDSMMSTVSSILPYVLLVVGAILVITLGIRLFKRFSKG